MRNIKPSLIIHIFALLHAVTALSCRLAGVEDEILLTILTIGMSLLICYRKNLSIEFTASIIIVGNINPRSESAPAAVQFALCSKYRFHSRDHRGPGMEHSSHFGYI